MLKHGEKNLIWLGSIRECNFQVSYGDYCSKWAPPFYIGYTSLHVSQENWGGGYCLPELGVGKEVVLRTDTVQCQTVSWNIKLLVAV